VRALIDKLESRYAWSTLQVDGFTWRWIDTAAAGPSVVLLPGSVGDGAMYVRTLLSLGERLRLIAVTYPELTDAPALANGLKAVFDHLGLPASVVVGSSFAAWWGQFFALRHPELVRKLVIGNGFTDASDLADNPLFDPEWVGKVAPQELHAQWVQRVQAAPVAPLQQLQKLMLTERQSAANLHARFLGVTRAQACPPLSLPERDVVVLDCEDDPLIPPVARDRLRRRYPGAQHVRLPHGGHYPHVLNAEAYESTLLDLAFA
jgi:pimeloyl-ACP methyl ester carboxylesterase